MSNSPKRSLFPSLNRRAGSILIIVLWVVSLLSLFVVSLGYGVRQKVALVNRLEERVRAGHLHDGSAYRAILLLKRELLPKMYDWLGEDWSNGAPEFRGMRVGNAVCDVYYDYVDEKGMEKRRYGLIDEERKVNINTADRHILERLFSHGLGLGETEAQELAASVVDWRDQDSNLSIPQGSAESTYYRGSEFPYEAKNAPFDVPDELLLVKGMTQEMYDKIKGYITVCGSGRININTAGHEVLMALGLEDVMVRRIEEFRAGKDKVHGTGDDEIFRSPDAIAAVIGDAFKLSKTETLKLEAAADKYLSTTSTAFTLNSHVLFDNRERPYNAACVVDRDGNILYWREG